MARATDSAATVLVRGIEGLGETRAVEELQREIWGVDDRDITPLTHLVAVKEAGGQLIGAFDGQTMVGFVYGFVGVEHGQTVHHSHLLAVKPAYRNLDVGYRLKLAQRERVLAQGIKRITWTFDPLQSVNAYFNFCKLGVISQSYRADFYGEETSSFLHRFGTDRLWVTWMLDSGRVLRRLRGEREAEEVEALQRLQGSSLLRVAADGSPGELDLRQGLVAQQALLEIPGNINTLQQQHPERAVRWREATRRAFSAALGSGFLIEGFFRDSHGDQSVGVYVLRRGRTMEDFA